MALSRGWMWGGALIAAFAVALVCGLFAAVLLLQPTPVTVVTGGEAVSVRTFAQTVGEVFSERGILVGEHDRVTPSLDTPLTTNLVIQIDRARPVILLVDGQISLIQTPLTDPAAILDAQNIDVHPDDRLILDGTVVTPDAVMGWPVPVSNISLRRAVSIALAEDGVRRELRTTAETVGEALFDAGIVIYMADSVVPSPDAPVTEGLTVTIDRARPVTIIADGARLTTRLMGSTVGDALAAAGVALLGADYAVPDEDQPLVGGMVIRVMRVQESEIIEEAELPYETILQASADLELDQRRTIQAGRSGREQRIIRVRVENGIEVSRTVAETVIAQPPVNHIIEYGTNVVIRSLDTPQGPRQYWRVLRMYATSYHPAALGGDDVTATGRRLTTGIIASSPRVIPYGAEVYVEGYGVGLMADTGGPRRFPLWIDLGYSDEEFRPWSRYVNVYLLTPVPATIDYLIP
jgi:uncharacterized protein YabE (DUF348 family)